MKKTGKLLALLMTIVMTVSMLSGCGNTDTQEQQTNDQSGESQANQPSEPQDDQQEEPQEEPGEPESEELVKVLTSGQSVVQCGLSLIAGERFGTWEKLGLDVERVHYIGGPPQLEANPSGDWEIGWIGATAAISGVLNYDMNIIALSQYDFSNMAFAHKDSDIAKAGDQGIVGTFGTADDWRGKDILCNVGTVLYADMLLTLESLGLTEEDVNIINMENSTAVQAIQTGEGDVMFSGANYTAMMLDNSDFVSVHSMEEMGSALSGSIICTSDYKENNADAIVKYLEGMLELNFWLADENNLDQASELYAELCTDEFGTVMTPEEAKVIIQMTGFKDMAFFEELCAVGDDGMTGMQREWNAFYDIYVNIGLAEEADREKIINAVDSSLLAQAIENYKANNG